MIKRFIKLMRMNPHTIALLTMGSAFSYAITHEFDLLKFILGTIIFTITYSAAYIINDLHDLRHDKKHRVIHKRKAPLITGEVSFRQAKITALLIIVFGITTSLFINSLFMTTITWLLILNIIYTFLIKKYVNLVPYWHMLITYVKLISGWSLINESIKLIPWTAFIIPCIVYGFYSLIYKNALMNKKEYLTHRVLLSILILLITTTLLFSSNEMSIKVLIILTIAIGASFIFYLYYKQKGLNASYIKTQYLGAALIWGLNLIIIS